VSGFHLLFHSLVGKKKTCSQSINLFKAQNETPHPQHVTMYSERLYQKLSTTCDCERGRKRR